jgi:CheY-like chemotaxis protein
MTMIDRRRHLRVATDVGVRVHAARATMRGHCVDLSRGGLRLRRDDDTAPCPAVGTGALVELALGRAGWVAQDGRIVRCDYADVAIEFAPLAEEVARMIDDELRAAAAATSRPRLLVVDPSADRRHHIAAKLRAAGCDPYEAATPLEAIDLIDRSANHIAGVAVATHLTQTDGDELCDFRGRDQPRHQAGVDRGRAGRRSSPAERVGEHHVDPTDDDTLERSLRGWVDAVHTPPVAAVNPRAAGAAHVGGPDGDRRVF